MFNVVILREEVELEKCVDFVLRHRRDFYPAYNLGLILKFLSEAMHHGELVAGLNEKGEIVGIAGYVYGTPEKKFIDKHRVQFELVCITQAYRKTGLFFQGLRQVVANLTQAETDVREIEFYAPANHPYLRKLFSKFATLTSTIQTKFGLEDLFLVTIENLTRYCDRLKPRRA